MVKRMTREANSKYWLTKALFELMETKVLSSITVKRICEQAEVSRETYYKNYMTKSDIIVEYLKKLFQDRFSKEMEEKNPTDLYSINVIYLQMFEDNRDFFLSLDRSNLRYLVKRQMSDSFVEIYNSLGRITERFNPQHYEYYSKLYQGGLVDLIMYWLQQTDRLTTQELARSLENYRNNPQWFLA